MQIGRYLRQEWKEGRLPKIKITISDIVPFLTTTAARASVAATASAPSSSSSSPISSSSTSSSLSSRSSSPSPADEDDVAEDVSDAYQALIDALPDDTSEVDLRVATGFRCTHSPDCHCVCRTKQSYEKHLLSHLMDEVRAEVKEAQKNRKVVQKLSTDSMSTLLGDTRRSYQGKEEARKEAQLRGSGNWYGTELWCRFYRPSIIPPSLLLWNYLFHFPLIPFSFFLFPFSFFLFPFSFFLFLFLFLFPQS